MRKVYLFMTLSLNGYFEGPNHDLSWHNVDDEFNRFALEQPQETDLLLFGRRTYQLLEAFRTRCENTGVSTVFVEMLMGHSAGLAGNYTKPTTKELAEQYAKAIPRLTLSEAAEAKNAIEKKVFERDRRVVDLERENLLLRQRLDRIEKGFDELNVMVNRLLKKSAE